MPSVSVARCGFNAIASARPCRGNTWCIGFAEWLREVVLVRQRNVDTVRWITNARHGTHVCATIETKVKCRKLSCVRNGTNAAKSLGRHSSWHVDCSAHFFAAYTTTSIALPGNAERDGTIEYIQTRRVCQTFRYQGACRTDGSLRPHHATKVRIWHEAHTCTK